MSTPAPGIRAPGIHPSTTHQILAVRGDRNCPAGQGQKVTYIGSAPPQTPPCPGVYHRSPPPGRALCTDLAATPWYPDHPSGRALIYGQRR